jgi:hypothetical protein
MAPTAASHPPDAAVNRGPDRRVGTVLALELDSKAIQERIRTRALADE